MVLGFGQKSGASRERSKDHREQYNQCASVQLYASLSIIEPSEGTNKACTRLFFQAVLL